MRICFLLIGIFVSAVICSQDTAVAKYLPKESMHHFKLGSTIIPLKILQYGNSKEIVIINVHDDETTAVNAAIKVLQETGGQLIKIENNNKRLVEFTLNKRQYKFDPNRIFSRPGIVTTLKKYESYSTLAVEKLQDFASFIINKIPAANTTLIAVHNNDEGRYSIHSYEKGGDYKKEAKLVNIGLSKDPDNFYFTTDTKIFNRLSSLRYNVVLQDNNKATNDGSLSIYYGIRKLSYVNVECKVGQVNNQSEMIKVLLTDQIKF